MNLFRFKQGLPMVIMGAILMALAVAGIMAVSILKPPIVDAVSLVALGSCALLVGVFAVMGYQLCKFGILVMRRDREGLTRHLIEAGMGDRLLNRLSVADRRAEYGYEMINARLARADQSEIIEVAEERTADAQALSASMIMRAN